MLRRRRDAGNPRRRRAERPGADLPRIARAVVQVEFTRIDDVELDDVGDATTPTSTSPISGTPTTAPPRRGLRPRAFRPGAFRRRAIRRRAIRRRAIRRRAIRRRAIRRRAIRHRAVRDPGGERVLNGHRHGRPARVAVDKEISIDLLVDSIEQALLVAYHHTPGAATQARVELDRDDRARDRVGPRELPGRRRRGLIPRESTTPPRASAGSRVHDGPAGPGPTASRGRGRRPTAISPARWATSSPAWSSRGRTPDESSSTWAGSRRAAPGGGRGRRAVPARDPHQVARRLTRCGARGTQIDPVAHPSRPGQGAVRAGGPGDRGRHGEIVALARRPATAPRSRSDRRCPA